MAIIVPVTPAAIVLLTADVITAGQFVASPQWGIYLNGAPVVIADSVVSLEYKRDWAIADFPLEEGAFASYDKVAEPYDAKLRFATGGSISDRTAMLNSIEAAAASLDLYDVVSPEKTYINANIFHFDYRRGASSGLGLIVVDVWLREVRVSGTSDFSNTKSPSGTAQVNTGMVQPSEPTAAQIAAIDKIQ